MNAAPDLKKSPSLNVSGSSSELLREFDRALELEDLAPKTRRAYGGDLSRFLDWFAKRGGDGLQLEAVTPIDIGSYRDELLAHGKKPASIQRSLASLRKFFGWLKEQGRIPDSPAEKIRGIRQVRSTAPKSLTNAEVNALFRAARSTGFPRDRLRNYMLVQLLAQTGLRLSELIELRWDDLQVKQRKGTLRVRDGKGRKARNIPLNATARSVLEDWENALRERHEKPPPQVVVSHRGEPMSPRSVQLLVADLARRASIDRQRVSPHVLRHTFALSYLSRHQGDLVGLANLMGHESISTTAIYAQPTEEDLATRMEELPLNAYA